MLPCTDPAVPAEIRTDNDVGLALVALAQAYADCRQRHGDLARWVRGR
jgi:hypothetical protein